MTRPTPAPDWLDLHRALGAEVDPSADLRVAIITPYHREAAEVLESCHASVRAQTHACTHIVIADGHPSPLVDGWDAQHITLPVSHANFGSTPRAIGSLSAVAQGFDAIAYLDADNWIAPDHVQAMVDLHRQSGAAVCVASRTLRRLDGSLLDARGEKTDGTSHVDTNCLFLTTPAFQVVAAWGFIPKALRPIDDRLMWATIRTLGVRIARRLAPTVHYRTAFRVHYEERGEVPPEGAKDHAYVKRAVELWNAMPGADKELVLRRLGARI